MSAGLPELFERYNSAAVTAMASFHGLPHPRPKGEQIAALARLLRAPEQVRRSHADLSAAEHALLEAILQRGGQASTRALRESLQAQGLVESGPPGRDRPNPRAARSRRFGDVLARLMLRGLVFPLEPAPEPNYGGTPPKLNFERVPAMVFVPQPIRQHLPAPAPAKPVFGAVPAVAHEQESSARVFQRDLYLYWSFVWGQPLILTAKDEPHKSALRDIAGRLLARVEIGKGLGELDHPRLRFLRLLLADLGLIALAGDRQWAASETADEFFGLPPAERVQRSYEAWRLSRRFSEVVLLPAGARPAKLGPAQLEAGPPIQHARQVVLQALAGSARAGWAALDDLVTHLRETDYEFLIPRPAELPYEHFYHPDPYDAMHNPIGANFPPMRGEADGWAKVEANFIRGIVFGPLYWLGLADLGWKEAPPAAGPPDALRLTPLGLWVLGRGPRPEIPAEGGRVVVQPNLHIVALDPINDATLVSLDRFAERLSAERAVEYRLTRASVYRGQLAGWDAARIQGFLREQTGAELPGNVARTLDEWQAQHERIVLRSDVTLAHGPAQLLARLAEDPRLSALIAARPLPEVLRLAGAQALGSVVEALGALGTLPLVSAAAEVPANAVEAEEDGRVRLLAPRPNLYLHGHLAAFADPAGDGAYQISALSVSRAARAGLGAADVLQQLSAVHRGPVPAGLARRIRAWAKHYGDAALEETVLLQVRDANTLAELLADPELAPLLKPFKPSTRRALARVRPEDLEALRARLAERGVDLKPRLE
ncbi:MAG: helicase-associated domain-containing protein [Anaerolineales bacterium]|nr:helicase-associated domain-containing protein [Anaerolineales bacterium]